MIYLPDDRTANLVLWVVLWSLILIWVLITTCSRRLPTFADLTRFVRRFWLLRWALLGFWIWLGWHLLIRTTA